MWQLFNSVLEYHTDVTVYELCVFISFLHIEAIKTVLYFCAENRGCLVIIM